MDVAVRRVSGLEIRLVLSDEFPPRKDREKWMYSRKIRVDKEISDLLRWKLKNVDILSKHTEIGHVKVVVEIVAALLQEPMEFLWIIGTIHVC